jgi:ketosteroid isomerase-like protein
MAYLLGRNHPIKALKKVAATPTPRAGSRGGRDRLVRRHETMAAIMRLRLPLDTRLVAVLPAEGLAMLVCERHIDGTGPDGRRIRLHGTGCTVVRPQPDGSWRIAADAWQLAGQGDGYDSLDGPGSLGEGL